MYLWQISTAFGMESLVRAELVNPGLGLEVQSVANGAVRVRGDARALAKMQLWLRCAERISLVLSSFRAADFDDLFEGMGAIAWEDILPWDAYIRVVCTLAANATITSARSAQSIAKKAIIERLRACSEHESFPESGELYSITIDIAADSASVLLDSCGDGLHRRGYRLQPGPAPLRETTAAAMVYLADWNGEKEILWDPFCGSGTLAIEAAMMQADVAPGLMRYFSSETWSFLDAAVFESERMEARGRAEAGVARPAAVIRASDISPEALSMADGNIRRAGMAGRIRLFKADARQLAGPGGETLFLTNPPYGERLGGEERLVDGSIRRDDLPPEEGEAPGELLAGFFASLADEAWGGERWRAALLSPERDLAGLGTTQRYGKNRKLYNGKLRVWMYFFEGPTA
jgi:putative N6-adenine-specific DNA methylase